MTDTSNVTVLVVDDEPDLAELYRVFLATEYDVRVANSGQEALDIIDGSVDIVLLDRRMPYMMGHEVLDAIRTEGYNVRVAMLTAVEPKDDITDMAFDDYRRKPISQDELQSLVEVLCHRLTLEKESQEFFRLASKKAALEAAGNTDTDAYETIVDQIDALDAELTGTLDHLSAEDAFAAIAED